MEGNGELTLADANNAEFNGIDVVDHDGEVLERSSISERTIITADVELRDGFTWYTNLGDAPIIIALLLLYGLSLAMTLRAAGSGVRARSNLRP